MSLRKHTIWNLAGGLLPLIAAAACIPYVLHQLGNEAFGVLTLIWALIGYFSLFDFGIGRALTYELSKLRGNELQDEIPATLKAGLFLITVTGIFGCLVMAVLAPKLATDWLKISVNWQSDAQTAFQIAAIGVVFTTITSGLRGALEGLERFAASNLNKIFLGLCMFALPALSVYLHGASLSKIALYLVGVRLFVMVLSVFQLRDYLLLANKPVVLCNIKNLISFGGWITVTGVVGPLMVYGDRFFVSAAVGASLLPLYAIPQEGLQRLLIIPMALCGALLPHLATLKRAELEGVYRRNYKRVAITMFGLCLLSASLIYPILTHWLSPEFAQQSLPIALILVVGIWLNSVSMVPYTLLHASGNPKITALLHLAELGVYVIALYFLTSYWGLLGAAVAWVGRVLLDLILLHGAAEKYFLTRTESQ
jgi:O-antigen/teichoic acid export membrane protein